MYKYTLLGHWYHKYTLDCPPHPLPSIGTDDILNFAHFSLKVQLHIVGAIGEIAKNPKAPLEILRCKGCKTLVDILNIPNEELTGTAARAIAACAANSSCRA